MGYSSVEDRKTRFIKDWLPPTGKARKYALAGLDGLLIKSLSQELKNLTDEHQMNSQDLDRQNAPYSTEVIPARAIYDRIESLEKKLTKGTI